jgi:DNA invertase Pin-like site-specific DNA recombinase
MTPLIAAAKYLRMSTESQQYSLANQTAAIAEYAKVHGFTIVRVYSDEARSGLTLQGRRGLRQLVSDVVSRAEHEYFAILVYDVSRWGRFQDTDESAHYEFLCKSSGVPVHYCAEPFKNDNTLANSLMKAVKRSLAGEFSRELGVKVHEGKSRIAAQGFHVGGRTPFGLRRQIVSDDAGRCRVLETGERKNLRSERLTLVPGPSVEVDCIREIFGRLIDDGMTAREIGRDLNLRNIKLRGRRWTKELIEYVLTNPEYAGVSTWGRTSQRLKAPPVKLSPDQWILKPNSFDPIISRSDFDRAQELLRPDDGRIFWSRERVEKAAQQLLQQKGELSYRLFDRTAGLPSSHILRKWNFAEICFSLGCPLPQRSLVASRGIRNTFRLHDKLLKDFVFRFPGELSILKDNWKRLLLDNRFVVSLLVCRALRAVKGKSRWRICPIVRDRANLSIICCLDATNTIPHSFFVFPRIDLMGRRQFGEDHPWLSTGQQLEDISQLCVLLRSAVYVQQHGA